MTEYCNRIKDSLAALQSLQRADLGGAFHSEARVGPHISACAHLVMNLLGASEPGDTERLQRFIAPLQLEDGSYPENPTDSHGSLTATAGVWGALAATGFSRQHVTMQRAEAWIENHGGLAGLVTQPLGLDPWSVGPLLAYAGLVDPKLFRVQSWLAIPTLVPGYLWIGSQLVSTNNLISSVWRLTLLSALQYAKGSVIPGVVRKWFIALERERTLAISQDFQNPNGSWLGVLGITTVAIASLRALDVSVDHPVLQAAIQWMRSVRIVRETPKGETLSYLSNGSDVWNTALSMESIVQAKRAGFQVDDSGISRAVEWLVETAHQCIQPPIESPGGGRLRRGGWAFEPDNVLGPDTDSTALVLRALATYERTYPTEECVFGVPSAMQAGRLWLLGMQHGDGGWGAFMARQPAAPRTILFEHPMLSTAGVNFLNPFSVLKFLRIQFAQLGDRSTASLSARVIEGLVDAGIPEDSHIVERALAFIRAHQRDGKWFGRWTVNYVPGTAYVVRALGTLGYRYDAAASETPNEANLVALRHAVEWLLSVQRSDGGWGDCPDSYTNPTLAGASSESMPGLTGLVLEALVAVGMKGPVIEQAASYLISTQHTHGPKQGTWDDDGWLQVFFPPNTLYLMPFGNIIAPLRGLLAHYTTITQRAHASHVTLRQGATNGSSKSVGI